MSGTVRSSRGGSLEALFRAGQRALDAHDTAGAVERLARVCERAPDYARARCWLAMAHAEAGDMAAADARFAEAEALRAQRTDVAPRTLAVFPMQRGLAWLDAGDLERAREHLERARALAPDNALVAAGLSLCHWDAGGERDPARLLLGLELLPRRHQARVLVRLSEHTRVAGRSNDAESGRAAARGPAQWVAARERRRSARLLERAQAAIAAGAQRKALDLLRDMQPMDADQRRRQHGLFAQAARQLLDLGAAELEREAPEGEARAQALFRMARLAREAGDDAEAAERAEQWLALFDDHGAPSAWLDDALDALSCVAARAVQRGDGAAAQASLARAFGLRAAGTGELHRVRAHARLLADDPRGARHDFEDWLAGFPLTAEYALLASSP